MRIAEQCKQILTTLKDWLDEQGGAGFVASDLTHMWRMATVKSNAVRAIVCYLGENIRGDFSVAAALGRVDREFIVLITRGRGFNANRGDSLIETKQDAKPLFEMLEDARDLLRGMVGDISAELPIDFKAVRTFQMGELILDAYGIEFSVATDLPRILQAPEEAALPGDTVVTSP